MPFSNGPGYAAMTVPTNGNQVHYPNHSNPRIQASSVWAFEAPSSEYENVWNKLSPEERMQVAKGLETPFTQAQFGTPIFQRYLADGVYGDPMQRHYGKLTAAVGEVEPGELPEDVIRARQGKSAFSDLLFLKAALYGKDVGLCQHQACAHAGLLYRLGAPAEDVELHYGKIKEDSPFPHFYGQVQISPYRTVTIDGTPEWKPSDVLRAKRESDAAGTERWRARFPHGSGIDARILVPKAFPKHLLEYDALEETTPQKEGSSAETSVLVR